MQLNMFFARFVVVYVSFLALWLPGTMLHGFNVELANDITDIIASRRILLRFSFDSSDNVLYRDSLRFSTDCCGLKLTSWQSSMPASSEYILSFKQAKLVYKESFLVDMQCALDNKLLGQQINPLEDASIYIAGLLLGSDGKNRSRSIVVSVGKTEGSVQKNRAIVFAQRDDGALLNDFVMSTHATMTINQHGHASFPNIVNREESLIDDDAMMFDKLLNAWNYVVLRAYKFLDSMSFFYLYILICLILILSLLRRQVLAFSYYFPCPGIWALECERFFGFLALGGVGNFLKFRLPASVIVGILAGYCFIASLYYFKKTVFSETFLGKLKVLLGMFLLIMVLPLLLKAYLLNSLRY